MKKGLIAIGLFLTVSLLGHFSRHLTVDNSHWLPPEDPVEELSTYVQNNFDQGEELVVAVHLNQPFFTPDVLKSLMALEKELKEALPEDEIHHPLNISFLLKNPSGSMEVTSLQKPWQKNQLSLDKMRDIFSDSYYHGRYISYDGKSFLLIIRPQLPESSLEQDRKRILVHDTLVKKMKNHPLFARFKMAGEVKLNHELNVQNVSELKRLFPLVFLVMMILLGFWYANAKAAFIVAFSAISASLGSLALFSLLEIPLNILTSIVPLLIMAIAVSDSIHIIDRHIHQKCQHLKELIRFTWKPCLITSLTTIVGFASFYGSSLVTIKQIALVGPLSILLAYILIMGSNWSLLYLLKPDIPLRNNRLTTLFHRLPFRRVPGTLSVLLPFLMISSLVVYKFARTETNLLDSFFQKEASIQQDFAWLDRNHGGSGSFELIIGRQNGMDFKNIDTYQTILRIKSALESVEGIERVESYAMPVEMTHRKLSGDGRHPSSTEALAQEILFLEFSQSAQSSDILRPFLSFNGKTGRLILRTQNLSNHKAEQIKRKLQQALQPFSLEREFSGNNQYFLHLGSLILDTQFFSLVVTLSTIFILVILFYNIKTSWLATLINLLPVCLIMLVITVTGTPFDFSTVLIAGICMGISIDNSIHLVHYISHSKEQDSRQAFQTGLQPVAMVSLLFLLVFSLFATSNIVLIENFGFFSALLILASLAANMFLVPALWAEKSAPRSESI